MANVNDIKNLYLQGTQASALYLGNTKLWPTGLPVGTVYDFSYTGTVQEVTLPPGYYFLQCWGAQGGHANISYGGDAGSGGKGGYSEGVLRLTKETTLYVFVGGQGSTSHSTSVQNGGWNGGGASTGYSEYSDSDGNYGYSDPASGGGGTDICTVSSTMTYSNYRTNRSQESLLSRFIVAGGGGGGSCGAWTYPCITSDYYWESVGSYSGEMLPKTWDGGTYTHYARIDFPAEVGKYYKLEYDYSSDASWVNGGFYDADTGNREGYASGYTINSSYPNIYAGIYVNSSGSPTCNMEVYKQVYGETETTCTEELGTFSTYLVGGGLWGIGANCGGPNSWGNGGGFGYGGNMTTTNYMHCSGGGGGGWYGGGTSYADNSLDTVEYGGGGSGFVNIAANAIYRPSGYTGLQLESGQTIDGRNSFVTPSGYGSAQGHQGNGYAKITVCNPDGTYPKPETTLNVTWSGDWTQSEQVQAVDGVQYSSNNHTDNSSSVIRCTFAGVTSITFSCYSYGESCCDYLTVGNLDSPCQRGSGKTTVKNTTTDITYTCDTGDHYVEFCYSKDGSVSTSPDEAIVYIKSVTLA